MESLDEFRNRARKWLAECMPRKQGDDLEWNAMNVGPEDARRARELQRRLFEGGFAGICYPTAYGGLGLSPDHQRTFTRESRPYQMPMLFNQPTLNIIGPTLLDLGTEEQKQRHIPAMLKGDELWVQFMSEPSGGSDMAGVTTSATQNGEHWVLNGSKIWSSYAYFSDYALCLARTDWEATKHRGLTMFIVKIDQPGVTVNRIKQADGGEEFCQEFFDDVLIPDSGVLGRVNDGWTAALQLLHHERSATGGSSPFASNEGGRIKGSINDLVEAASDAGTLDDLRTRLLISEAFELQTVQDHLVRRISAGVTSGALPPTAGAILKLCSGLHSVRRTDIALAIAGEGAVWWQAERKHLRRIGESYLMRQAACLGGGSTEMQRNIISERILGMPRESTEDRDRPFREVRRNSTSNRQRHGA